MTRTRRRPRRTRTLWPQDGRRTTQSLMVPDSKVGQ
jgi:hypothetical protein